MHFYDEILKSPKRQEEKRTDVLTLKRTYLQEGTHGTFIFPDGKKLDTLELPWNDNKQRVSCIPEGEYILRKRYSPVVKRSSGQEFSRGWEVTDVENRTYIMIHPGNYVRNFLGCIGVGLSKGFQGNSPVIWNSRAAFRKFMSYMEAHEEWTLIVES